LLRLYARGRLRRLAQMDPGQAQRRTLSSLIRHARGTEFGRDHGFSADWSLDDYRSRVPLRDYDAFWEAYWRDPFPRLTDCTWPGPIPWFAASSGTTTGTTKYIPVSREMRRSNVRAGAELMVHHLANRPESRLLGGRVFMLGGSTGLVRQAPGVSSGDLSGIAAAEMPGWARLRYFPPRELESIADWEEKIDRFAARSLDEEISAVAGTPSWLLIFFERLAEVAGSGSGRVAEIWPRLEMLSHGGVAWAPYRDRFAALLEGSGAETREVYPASEGFFAIADGGDGEGLRLLLDTGIFYEFIPLDQLDSPEPDCRWVGDAEPGVNYALAVTTCAGLWRYLVGDTVTLVGHDPPRVLVTGRTSYMLSAFGEHVIGAEVERAVAEAARAIGATVTDFSAGSLFPEEAGQRGGHLYIVEFGAEPGGSGPDAGRQARFAEVLDAALCRLNDDYDAHRAGGYGLDAARVHLMPPGGFAAWMKSRGKLGGQNKVPRIVNDRDLFAALQAFADAYGEAPRN
ncbi:MAG: GH3 auxin-responsive promoter family protein, partial [Alphaproteobacteria bacterium]|nr:GH3 auxin-responsive promoter family protein [Alphaproteobacteria bacterium]